MDDDCFKYHFNNFIYINTLKILTFKFKVW